MTDNFKMCLELTEELEKHKKRINQYKQKLKAKEQECERLKEEKAEILEKTGMIETLQGYTVKDIEYMEQQLDQLKACLTEIKEFFNEECIICKENYINITGEICEECKYKDILQKISEVEDG